MVVTITGANDHSRKRELAQIVAAFMAEHGDMAIERLDGEEASADRMREAVSSLPFLSSRKLVILREPSKQKAFGEAVADVLQEVADTTDLVIYEPKLDKRASYYKNLKKLTDFRECAELDVNALAAWSVDYAKEQGGSLTSADARLLIDRVGTSQQLLQSELTKLLHYNPAITKDTVELLTERQPQSTVFELLDAAFSGNKQRMFDLYQEQRALRVEPQAIIAMLAWQLHILAVVKAAGKRSVEDIAKEAKINPYVVRKSQGITRKLTPERIKRMVGGLLELDTQLKRTALDADEALQLFLLRITEQQ